MQQLDGTNAKVGKVSKVRTLKAWSVMGVLSILGGLAFLALDVGAAPVVPVESGTGAENGRNVATVNLPGAAGITQFSARSFSFGGERPEPTAGGGAARLAPRLLTIVKPIDSNTPAFFNLATGGNNINTITLTVPATGISAAATYTFTNSSVIADNHSDKGRPTSSQELEEVSFTYRRLQVQVGNVVRCFDFGTATAC
jgi:hypothetical protein